LHMAEEQFAALPFSREEADEVRRGNAQRLFRPFAARCCGGIHP
jgi:hypothetical protein